MQAVVNLVAGAPLLAVIVAILVFRKFTKLVKRLLIVGVVCAAVLLANNLQLVHG